MFRKLRTVLLFSLCAFVSVAFLLIISSEVLRASPQQHCRSSAHSRVASQRPRAEADGLFAEGIYISDYGAQKKATIEDDVTLIVKSFERPGQLSQLLTSVRDAYPNVRTIVADDSRAPAPGRAWVARHFPWVEIFSMPFDQGNSRGRNLLLSQVRTKYFVSLDDDFLFGAETKLDTLLEFLEIYKNITIACGAVLPVRYSGNFDVDNQGVLNHVKIPLKSARRLGDCEVVDICPQFFMARAAPVQRFGGWDARFHIFDHSAFFLRAWKARNVHVAFCSTVSVLHSTRDEEFPMPWNMSRGRGLREFGKFLDSYNLTAIREFNGDLMVRTRAAKLYTHASRMELVSRGTKFDSLWHTFFLATCILSAPHNFARRAEARRTWLQDMKRNGIYAARTRKPFIYRFVIGQVSNDTLREQLVQESTIFKDILFLPDVVDAYTNLTAKTRGCLSFMGRYRTQFVLKTDDDTFIYFDRLLDRLFAPDLRGAGNRTNVIIGSMKHQSVVRDGSRYDDPAYEGRSYPLLARGGAYILSGDIASYITINEDTLYDYVLEDAAFAIWTASLFPRKINDFRFFQGHLKKSTHLFRESFDGLAVVQTKAGQFDSIYSTEHIAKDETFSRSGSPHPEGNCPVSPSFHDRIVFGDIADKHRALQLYSSRLNLIDAKNVLNNELKIEFFLMGAGVLGFARDCMPVANETALEVGIFVRDLSDEIESAFVAGGFEVRQIHGTMQLGYVLTFVKRRVAFSVVVHYDQTLTHGVASYWHGLWNGSRLQKIKVPHFVLVWVDFLNVKVLAPRNVSGYLDVYYGPVWQQGKIPRPS